MTLPHFGAVVVVRVILGLLGAVVALSTVGSAVRTTVLPRAAPSRLAAFAFALARMLFRLRVGRAVDYATRDRIYAGFGPFGLFTLLATWLGCVLTGFAALHWAVEPHRSVRDAFVSSGSALFTLGFDPPHSGPQTAVTFVEAASGLFLVALLISYLPAIYTAFSRRELVVTKLEVRANTPPTGWDLLIRAFRISGIDRLPALWVELEGWFADIEESHTSFPVLVYFRSPQPDHSWITAAGAVLDGASLLTSTVDVPRDVDAQLAIRAGYLTLRRIADGFGIAYDANPPPDGPITVTRNEFEEAADRLAAAGVPVRADREQAWRDFAGWRVNYDTVLVALAGLIQAPYAPWSSDRSPSGRITGRRRARRS
ncbi:MAG TPA: hypothetical protein VHE83_17335 [Mycobacteriales bacterium]|nr:hypothetical protein [Mycobacteriales bacterium]